MKKKKNIYFFGIVLLTVLPWLLIVILTLPMVFMTNDDTSIQIALSGNVTGESYPYHQFINVFLGWFLSGLYNIFPNVKWWYVWSMACILIGIFFIHKSVIEVTAKKIKAIAVVCVLGALFWVYIIANVSFAIVPCVLTVGAVCTLFVEDSMQWQWSKSVGCVITILIASWHRASTAKAMLCYLCMGLLYYVIHCNNLGKKQRVLYYIGTVAVTIVLMFFTSMIDTSIKAQKNMTMFAEFDEARIAYMDYPHASYEEAPEVYQKYGWDEKMATLVGNWCFLDERFNTESINGILQETKSMAIQEETNSLLAAFNTLLMTNVYAKILLCFLVLMVLGEVWIVFSRNVRTLLNFFYIANLTGSVILLFYLSHRGRLPLRAFMVIVLPMICIGIILLLKISEKNICERRILIFRNIGFVIGVCISLFGLVYNYDPVALEKKYEKVKKSVVVENYAKENGDKVFIYELNGYNSINPFGMRTCNLIFWGGSTFYSDYFYRHMDNAGVEKLNMEIFKRDDVFMLAPYTESEKCDTSIETLFDCLVDYHAVAVERVDELEEYDCVYKFYFDEDLQKYTGFYEIEDYTFYYKDGKRQTGIIEDDGKMYICGDDGLVLCNGQYINTWGYIKEEYNPGAYEISGEYYSDGWMGNEIFVNIYAETDYVLKMQCVLPDILDECTLTLCSESGEIVDAITLYQGSTEVVFHIPGNGISNYKICANNSFRPTNGDARELSIHISEIVIEKEE